MRYGEEKRADVGFCDYHRKPAICDKQVAFAFEFGVRSSIIPCRNMSADFSASYEFEMC